MQRVLAAGFAQFLEFQALLNNTLIFVRVIVGVLAHGAFQFDQVILGGHRLILII